MTDWRTISGVISDLDGVTYRGDQPIDSAVRAFQRWRHAGIPYAFVTNNSTKTAAEFAAKLSGMGIPAQADDVVTSSVATAATAAKRHEAGTRALVVGADALQRAIEDAGFVLGSDDVGLVVAGLDRAFDYEKLKAAQQAILAGAAFYGTNPDRMLPSEVGFDPGAGSILAAIEACTGQPPLIIGKPEPTLVEMALDHLGTARAETLMIGDQVATDILAGKSAGLPTLLVRTGVRETGPLPVEPDFEVADLGEIVDRIAGRQ